MIIHLSRKKEINFSLKADVIVLPTISISVYLIGAITAYVSGVLIYESLADEGMDLWDSAWSGDHMSDYHYLTEGRFT